MSLLLIFLGGFVAIFVNMNIRQCIPVCYWRMEIGYLSRPIKTTRLLLLDWFQHFFGVGAPLGAI